MSFNEAAFNMFGSGVGNSTAIDSTSTNGTDFNFSSTVMPATVQKPSTKLEG